MDLRDGYQRAMSQRVETSKRLLLINSASGAAARIINVSVLVWLNQFLLRRISKEEYSLYPSLMAVILLVPLITSVLTAGLSRYVLAAYARNDDREVTQIVSTMFPIVAVVGAVLLAGGWLFAWHVDKILTVPLERLWDARIMMGLLVFSIAMRVVFAPFGVGIYVRQKFVLYNMMNVSNQMFRALLLFLLLCGLGARVLWVVVANAAAEITLLSGTCLVSRRLIPSLRFRVREMRWSYARVLVSFGGWSFFGALANHLRATAIPLIMNKMAPLSELTVFYVGMLARRQIDTWVQTMMTPLYPVVTGMHAMGAYERVRNTYTRGGRLALWVILLPALPAIIYSQTLIRLYIGNDYADAGVVMVLTLSGLPIIVAGYMLWPLAIAAGRVRLAGASALATQMAVVAGAIYMVRQWQLGAIGVALAVFTIPTIAAFAVNWRLGQRLAGIKFQEYARKTLLLGLTPGCVAAMVWTLLDVVVGPDGWVALGLCAAVGMICYVAILLGFCLEPEDKQDLATVLRKVRSVLTSRRGEEAGPDLLRNDRSFPESPVNEPDE